MSFLTGGLAGIMAAYRPPAAAAAAASQGAPGTSSSSKPAVLEAAATPHAAAAAAAAAAPAELGVSSLMSAVVAAVDELPVWESPEVEQVGLAGHGVAQQQQRHRMKAPKLGVGRAGQGRRLLSAELAARLWQLSATSNRVLLAECAFRCGMLLAAQALQFTCMQWGLMATK
jgi:hypothetical protein